MPTHRGFSAWIVSGGEVLSEHLVAVDTEKNQVQCWVPGEEGNRFEVYWRDYGSKVDSCAFIYLDGYCAPGRFLYGQGLASREGVRSGPDTERPFMFSKVDDEQDPDTSLDGPNNEAGMITLKIKLVERVSYRPNNSVQSLPTRRHGRQAAGSLRVGYGTEKKAWPQCPTTWAIKPTSSYVTFIFRYRSSEFLRAQGIMSEAPTSEKSRSKRASVRRNPSGTAAPPSVTPNEGVLTPSPTPSPKTGKANLDRMSPSMKRAFYPGMAGLGRMRAAHDRPRTSDQGSWEGLISFADGTGKETIFATPEVLKPEPPAPSTQSYYPNVDYYGPEPGKQK